MEIHDCNKEWFLLFLNFNINLNLETTIALSLSNVPEEIYFVLKQFSLTSTIRFAYRATRLLRHDLFGPLDDVITEFDCIHTYTQEYNMYLSNICNWHISSKKKSSP
jgi:hypothetical protein